METIPSPHHLNINLMNAAFNVTAKYNTALISLEREREHGGCNGGEEGGNGQNEEEKEKMRGGNMERARGLGQGEIGVLSSPIQ